MYMCTYQVLYSPVSADPHDLSLQLVEPENAAVAAVAPPLAAFPPCPKIRIVVLPS